MHGKLHLQPIKKRMIECFMRQQGEMCVQVDSIMYAHCSVGPPKHGFCIHQSVNIAILYYRYQIIVALDEYEARKSDCINQSL